MLSSNKKINNLKQSSVVNNQVMKVEKQFEAIKKQKRTNSNQLLYLLFTPPIAKIICVENARAKVFCGIVFSLKRIRLKI